MGLVTIVNFLLLTNVFTFVLCFDPFSATSAIVGTTVSIGFAAWKMSQCRFQECCDNTYVRFDPSELERGLQKVFGQHLIGMLIPNVIRGHADDKDPSKALALSFHGPTGTGKNLVSQIIAKSLYKYGMGSQYVHLYTAESDFPHEQDIAKYQDKIRRDIEGNTSLCENSMFIFDEVDKMPAGLLGVLKPYLDHHQHIRGVNYRKNIFIFLSNDGGHKITELALRSWAEGNEIDSLTLKDIEPVIEDIVLHQKGGFQYTGIVQNYLIDMYIPFFPLEKSNVRKCIESILEDKGLRKDLKIIDIIANQIEYFPREAQLYSKSGCKRLDKRIAAHYRVNRLM